MQPMTLIAFLVCAGLAVISGEPQFPYAAAYPYYGIFPSTRHQGEARFFFNTQTIVIATSTTTTTKTSTTTCTTSTAALSSCVASGRRRRALEKGLYYEDDAAESIFLPAQAKPEETASDKEVEPVRPSREVVVPIMLEPGFAASRGIAPRFLLAFSISTVTKTATTTATSSLIATCSSASNFALCGSSGK